MFTKTAYKLVRLQNYSSLFAQPPYAKYYVPGTVVTASPGTLGLMVWSDRYWAKEFVKDLSKYTTPVCLLKVIPFNLQVVDYICESADPTQLTQYYALPFAQRLLMSQPLPPGTECYGSVKVLKQIPL